MTCDESIKSVHQKSPETLYPVRTEQLRVYQKACIECASASGGGQKASSRETDRYPQMRAMGDPDWAYRTGDPDFTPEQVKRAHSPTADRAAALRQLLQSYDHTVAAGQYVSKTKTLIVLLYPGKVIPGSLACLLERDWGTSRLSVGVLATRVRCTRE